MTRREASDMSKAVADVLLGRYKTKRLSQSDLAERTGISLTTIQRIVAGKTEIDVEQLALIADALDTTSSEIVAEAEQHAAAKRMSEGVPQNVLPFDKRRPDTVEELESYTGQKAAHRRDPESDQPED